MAKKMLCLVLALAMTLTFVACGGSASSAPAASSKPASSEAGSTATEGAEIAMITDKGDINDKSFNQGTWEGVKAYADANGKTCQYYKPADATNDEYVNSIEQAIQNGAKVVVTPGFLFEVPIYTVQEKYPDVSFILIDGNPHNDDYSDFKTADNTVGITFSEEQVGYLAGYAAVKDGNTKLGFLGGQPVPAVVRYGYGFVQGADAAAKEMGVDIEMMYTNTDGFAATPEAQAMAASWYKNGTTIIFACGGSVGNSVMAAAEAEGGKVIGVDVDQSSESATVVSSAMKGLAAAVQQMLEKYYANEFPGGQNLNLGAAENALGLPMETSKFEKFTEEDYKALFESLASGKVTLQKDTDAESADKLKAEKCKVTVVAL